MTTYADAAVEVIADFDKFDDQFARRLKSAVTRGAGHVQRHIGGISGTINRTIGSIGRLGVAFVAVVGKAALAATALAAFSAVSAAAALQLAALAGALAPIGGLVAALPAALAAGIAGMAVFKLAAVGMKDVTASLAAGDLDRFNEALKNLSPNARLFAQQLRSLKPHLDSLRMGVQDRVFAGLGASLRGMTTNLLPTLRVGLGGMADAVNRAAKGVAGFLSTGTARTQLAQIFESARKSASNLGGAMTPIVKALLGVAQVGGPAIERITAAIGRAAVRFAAWVQKASETGRLKEILDKAFAAAKSFGGVIADVGRILKTVFAGAAGAAGGDLLKNLKELTGAAVAFLGSGEGKAGLAAVFKTIKSAGDPLLKTLGSIAKVVSDSVAPIFARLATAVGPGLDVLVQGIAAGVAALVPVAEPVGRAFSALAAALGPVAAQGGLLVAAVLGPLAEALSVILPALAPVVDLLGRALVGAVSTLLPPFLAVVTAVAGVLPHLLELGRVLVEAVSPAFATLGPALAVLVPALGVMAATLATSLAPTLPVLAQALVDAFGPIGLYADSFVALVTAMLPLVPAFAQLLPPVVALVPLFALLVDSLITGLVPVLETVVGPIVALADWLAKYPSLVQAVVIALGAWILVSKAFAAAEAVKVFWLAKDAQWSIVQRYNTVASVAGDIRAIAVTYAKIAAQKLWTAAQFAGNAVAQIAYMTATAQVLRDAATVTWTGAKTAATWLWNAAQSGAAIAAGVWTAAQWALNVALNANPIGLIVVAVGLLVAGIVLAYKHSAAFRDIIAAVGRAFADAGQWIADAAGVIWEWIKKAFDFTPIGVFINVFRQVIGHWDDIKAAFAAGVEAIGGFFARMGGYVTEFIGWYLSLPGRVWNALLSLGSTLFTAFTGAFEQAKAAVVNGILALVGFFDGLRNQIIAKVSAAGEWLKDAGGRIVEGLYNGIKNKFSVIFDAMKTLGESVPKWVKEALGISSPSTVMYQVGVDTVDGYANGISRAGAKAEAEALRVKIRVQEALTPDRKFLTHDPYATMPYGTFAAPSDKTKRLATRGGPTPYGTYLYEPTELQKNRRRLQELEVIAAGKGTPVKAKAKFTPLTGLGDTAGKGMVSKAAAAAAKEVAKQKEAVTAAGKLLGDGFIEGLTGASTNAKIKATTAQMAKLVLAGLGKAGGAPVVAAMEADSRRLRTMADNRAKVTKDLATAQKGLDDLLKASDKLRESIADKVRGAFELIPATGTRSVDALIGDMSRAVTSAQAFARNIETLKARGLATSLLQQLAEAGPTAGGAMAKRLAAATDAQLAQLTAMSGTLDQAAKATGTAVSNAMYASGIAASKGLVAGLTSQQKQIEAAMLTIAKSMSSAIRKALGIKSPSSVMALVGRQAGAGLERGLLSQVGPIRAAMATVGGVMQAPAIGVSGGGIPVQRGTVPGGGGVNVTNNIHLPTGDPQAAANSVVNRIAALVG